MALLVNAAISRGFLGKVWVGSHDASLPWFPPALMLFFTVTRPRAVFDLTLANGHLTFRAIVGLPVTYFVCFRLEAPDFSAGVLDTPSLGSEMAGPQVGVVLPWLSLPRLVNQGRQAQDDCAVSAPSVRQRGPCLHVGWGLEGGMDQGSPTASSPLAC